MVLEYPMVYREIYPALRCCGGIKNIIYENLGFCCYGEHQWWRRPCYWTSWPAVSSSFKLIEHIGTWRPCYAVAEPGARTYWRTGITHLTLMKRALPGPFVILVLAQASSPAFRCIVYPTLPFAAVSGRTRRCPAQNEPVCPTGCLPCPASSSGH